MDIKLRARLSAYSKVDSIGSGECEDIGSITHEEIDELFKNMDTPISVKKDDIDTLFDEQNNPESVSKDAIDSLFSEGDDTVISVSYSEIDSLFK